MGRRTDFLGGEEAKVGEFSRLMKMGTARPTAFRRAFPITTESIIRSCAPSGKKVTTAEQRAADKRAGKIVAKRAARLAQRMGFPPAVAAVKRVRAEVPEIPVGESVATAAAPAPGFANKTELEEFLLDGRNLFTSREEEIKFLRNMLSVGRRSWEGAVLSSDPKSIIVWTKQNLDIASVLQKYDRNKNDDDSETAALNALREAVKSGGDEVVIPRLEENPDGDANA